MRFLAFVLGIAFIPGLALAHQKSVSYSKWMLDDDGGTVQAKVSWFDLTSLPQAKDASFGSDSGAFVDYLEKNLRLFGSDQPCEPIAGSRHILPSERGWLRAEWQVRCSDAPTSLRSDLFRGLANHVHLATVLGPVDTDVVLSSTSPSARFVEGGSNTQSGLLGYVVLGIEHILTGWDHLAFLFLLIVIARRLREVVLLVTGFTVGHSITLAAASLGAIVPSPRAVESIIAASILVVALENARVERTTDGRLVVVVALGLFVAAATLGGVPAFFGLALFAACYFVYLGSFETVNRLRWALACLFGFVHGLGFSGVLLERSLSRHELVEALFGFNIGVELGQLAIVAAIWPVLQWLRGRDLGGPIVEWTSVAGAAVGTFALVARVFSS